MRTEEWLNIRHSHNFQIGNKLIRSHFSSECQLLRIIYSKNFLIKKHGFFSNKFSRGKIKIITIVIICEYPVISFSNLHLSPTFIAPENKPPEVITPTRRKVLQSNKTNKIVKSIRLLFFHCLLLYLFVLITTVL